MLTNIIWPFTQVYEKIIDLVVPIKLLFHNLLCNELNCRFSFIVSKSASSNWFTCQVKIQYKWESQIIDAFSMARGSSFIFVRWKEYQIDSIILISQIMLPSSKRPTWIQDFLLLWLYIYCWFQITISNARGVELWYISKIQIHFNKATVKVLFVGCKHV